MDINKRHELDELVIKSKVFAKNLLKLSPIAGFIFLNGYLGNFGASFPIDLESLPVLLLSMGIMSLLIVALFSGIIVVGGAYNIDPLDIGYSTILQSISAKNDRSIFLLTTAHIFISYVVPFLIAFVIFNWMELPGWWMLGELLIVFCTWSFCYGCLMASWDESQKARVVLFKVALHGLGTLCFSFMCCLLFLLLIFGLVKPITNVDNVAFFALAILYTSITALCMYPEHPAKETAKKVIDIDSQLAEPGYVIARPTQKNTPLLKPWILIAALSVYGIFIPGGSYVIGRIPLRIMHIGGELDFVAQDKAENCSAWPEYIKAQSEKKDSVKDVDKTEKDYCKSNVGRLIIKIKDRAYVVFEDNAGVPHLEALRIEDATLENELPKGSLYVNPKPKGAASASAIREQH